MPTAIWRTDRQCSMEAQPPFADAASYREIFCGALAGSGGTKDGKRRPLLRFDLTRPPDVGVEPANGATITAATLALDVTDIDGPTAWGLKLYTLTQQAWAGFTAAKPTGSPLTSWNYYNTSTPSAWATPGGDYAASPSVAGTSPAALGRWELDVAAIVLGLNDTHLVLISDKETENVTRMFSAAWSFASPSAGNAPELVITTEGALATTDERDPARLTGERPRTPALPSGGARAARPARPARPRS